MNDHAIQTASGCVTSVSQKTISTKVWSNNLGWTTQGIEEITLRLDACEVPLVLRTSGTRRLFIAACDQLTVAYARSGDCAALYGIHNVTDGSVYLVRPAKIAAARTDMFVTLFVLVALILVFGIISAVARSMDGIVNAIVWFGAGTIGLFVLSTILRTVFGVIVWPEVRRLTQPGGKREMHAAKHALLLADTETPNIRFL